jgi:hypothetical protein
MTFLRASTLTAAALASTISMHARNARAYTFVDELPEDACTRARAFDPQDAGPAAQHARRTCRLDSFEQRMAEERRRALASQQEAHDAWVEKWMVTTQPARVLHPMAVELFGGSGITSYGVGFSWNVLRQLELGARVGQRQMSCTDQNNTAANCTRTTWGLGLRWIFGDKDFSPFVGTAFSATSAPLKIVHFDPARGAADYFDGKGSANSLSVSAGLQLAVSYLRLSLEYLYEYVFYTGANLNDEQRTPSEDLRVVWADSLQQDRHGVRFQVGFAF